MTPARRRHRLGQDGSLFRGDRRSARARAAGARADARDRAHQPVHRPLRASASARKPAEWHSGVPAPQRGRVWRAVAENKAKLVVGARSALFLPFPELGLIVVDEEHDAGYKQEERVAYQARDMAVVRGIARRFPVVLSSATPSIESLRQCRAGPLPPRRARRRATRRRTSGHHRDRHARLTAGARQVAVAGAGRCGRRDARRAASRRSCSSTGAAMRR